LQFLKINLRYKFCKRYYFYIKFYY